MLNHRGSALNIVVISLSLLVLLLFLGISSGLQQAHLAHQLSARGRARDAAESMLQLAMAQLGQDSAYGENHAAGAWLRCDAGVLGNDCEGLVSFDAAVAAGGHIPVSTNNLKNDSSVPGDGRSVPARGAHLVALGRCGSERLQVETVYIQPPFPSGCAAKGPVSLRAVRLWGLPPDQLPPNPLLPDPQVPAHVFSNSASPSALQLGPACEVFGDAAAAGQVQVDPAAVVRGEVRSGAGPQEVPHFDLAGMYGSVSRYVGQVPYVEGRPVETYCVVASDLAIAGDLELRGGVLAVDGDVQVAGRLSGQGFVLATGNVTARAGATLSGEQKLALLAGGDLTLEGQSGGSYFFNGLVYSQGNVRAHDLTILGSLIADGRTGQETVDLQQVDVVQTRVAVTGGVAEPRPFNHPTGQLVATLQSHVHPTDPPRRTITGSVVQNTDRIAPNVFPRLDRPGFVITLAPPKAIFRRMGAGGVTLSQQEVPYSGGEIMPYAPSDPEGQSPERIRRARMTEAGRIIESFLAGEPTRRRENVLDKVGQQFCYLVQTSGGDRFQLDVNQLIPGVERMRLLTWKESQPSR